MPLPCSPGPEAAAAPTPARGSPRCLPQRAAGSRPSRPQALPRATAQRGAAQQLRGRQGPAGRTTRRGGRQRVSQARASLVVKLPEAGKGRGAPESELPQPAGKHDQTWVYGESSLCSEMLPGPAPGCEDSVTAEQSAGDRLSRELEYMKSELEYVKSELERAKGELAEKTAQYEAYQQRIHSLQAQLWAAETFLEDAEMV